MRCAESIAFDSNVGDTERERSGIHEERPASRDADSCTPISLWPMWLIMLSIASRQWQSIHRCLGFYTLKNLVRKTVACYRAFANISADCKHDTEKKNRKQKKIRQVRTCGNSESFAEDWGSALTLTRLRRSLSRSFSFNVGPKFLLYVDHRKNHCYRSALPWM